jgi:hypothetical protein
LGSLETTASTLLHYVNSNKTANSGGNGSADDNLHMSDDGESHYEGEDDDHMPTTGDHIGNNFFPC